jgi:hypothetical protein
MSNQRNLYRHLRFVGMLIDSRDLWELTEHEFNTLNKPTRKRYKHYRETRGLTLFVKPITALE